tara:strand:- start:3201 stop:3698 length:498 start_codon:yes stop_codon:yes gene_type:complete
MKFEPFEYNLKNKIVPMAQSILIRHGNHIPTIFTYDKNGIEHISDLSELFSIRNKDLIYEILKNFLDESGTLAFILVTEAWFRRVDKDDEDGLKESLKGSKRVSEYDDKEECITFQWSFKSNDVKSGVITYPFQNVDGNIIIDYNNKTLIDNDKLSISRASKLLK